MRPVSRSCDSVQPFLQDWKVHCAQADGPVGPLLQCGIHSDLHTQLLNALPTRWGRKTGRGGPLRECGHWLALVSLQGLKGSLHSFPQCRSQSTAHVLVLAWAVGGLLERCPQSPPLAGDLWTHQEMNRGFCPYFLLIQRRCWIKAYIVKTNSRVLSLSLSLKSDKSFDL